VTEQPWPQARSIAKVDMALVNGESVMLKWALIFAVVALIAGALGFTGMAGAAAGIAKILFFLFVIGFLVFLVLGFMAGKKITGN
jgi:uncharacterized membrane protein YtjA (UPF0391 family)